MKLKEILNVLEQWAPLGFQEEYDNAGLLSGDPEAEIVRAMISLDLTPRVIAEAVEKNCNLVISHHPFIFKGLKKIVAGTPEYLILKEALNKGINLYAIHTNLDNSPNGINRFLCEKLGLRDCRILSPKQGILCKLVTFCPTNQADQVRNALFEAGAGHIGNYDLCSFNSDGSGTFRAGDQARPFVGEKTTLHREPEVRIEVIFPNYLRQSLIRRLKSAHPYEEVAYDIYSLINEHEWCGAGMIGTVAEPISAGNFLEKVKDTLKIPALRYAGRQDKKILRVAICSGSGAFLIPEAIAAKADVFLTGDLKYHDFQGNDPSLLLADMGHYESEQWAKELIYGILNQKFPNFAVLISETEQNPVKYL